MHWYLLTGIMIYNYIFKNKISNMKHFEHIFMNSAIS